MLHARYGRAPLRPDTPPPTSAEPPPKPSGASGAKQRDPFFDNAKYLTIVLVGIGHAWDPLRGDSRAAEALYYVVYTFHMPAFVLISGYLSRNFAGKPSQLRRLVTGVVVPYVIFEIVYTLFMRWAADDPERNFSLQKPGFALWFLIALFVWRLTTPFWQSMRWPVPIALGVAVAASVTPDIGEDLNLMRLLQFLPYFVLGLQLRPEHFQLVKRRSARLLAVPVVALTLLFSYWAVPRMSKEWFLHDKSAEEMAVPSWAGATMYLALFGCALVLTLCFLSWVPRRRMWFTALGGGTLYAYLLHVYPVKMSREFHWYDMDWVDHPLSRVVITLLAVAMMTVLCTPPVQRLFRFAMEPKMTWFFKEDSIAKAKDREKGHGQDRNAEAEPAPAPAPAPAGHERGEPAGR